MTQVRLSIELEVSQENISAYETGKYYPSVKSLLKMRDIFHASIDYILGVSDKRMPSVPNGMLSDEEIAIIDMYRQMNEKGKVSAKTYMQGYLDAQY